ncbi:uncharacterized protein [Littorina saxatilis]|uniref:Uncharacterized protein n=1 Tax=Littorina saxatilis TaxID=31220 RepID=A0AAN9AZ72_9CAEN
MSREGDLDTETLMETDEEENKISCRLCPKQFPSCAIKPIMSDIVIADILGQTRDTGVKIEEIAFIALFCALLNMQESISVIFHVDDLAILNTLDNKWNDTIMKLAPDYLPYHDIFERKKIDEHHFRVRVEPHSDEKGILRTYAFHSSLSLDRGLDRHPSHSTMQYTFDKAQDSSVCASTSHDGLPSYTDFKLNQEIRIPLQDNGHSVCFQEDQRLQAKRIGKTLTQQELGDSIWNFHELGEYISALSKVPGGGIVYFGIHEQKKKNTKFISEGVPLSHLKKCNLKESFDERASDLLWVGQTQPNDADNKRSVGTVKFIPLPDRHGQIDRYIIEVTVRQFKGVCFFRKNGPESYELNQENEPEEVKPWQRWAALSNCKTLKVIETQFEWHD